MFTKQQVIDMLNAMKDETDRCVGFIAGNVTKGWVHQMLDERIREINAAEDEFDESH